MQYSLRFTLRIKLHSDSYIEGPTPKMMPLRIMAASSSEEIDTYPIRLDNIDFVHPPLLPLHQSCPVTHHSEWRMGLV